MKIVKEFKFSSIKNISENWHIFDPKLSKIKAEIEEKQQNDLLMSFKPGSMGGLGDMFKSNEPEVSKSNEISPYYNKYLKMMNERVATVN